MKVFIYNKIFSTSTVDWAIHFQQYIFFCYCIRLIPVATKFIIFNMQLVRNFSFALNIFFQFKCNFLKFLQFVMAVTVFQESNWVRVGDNFMRLHFDLTHFPLYIRILICCVSYCNTQNDDQIIVYVRIKYLTAKYTLLHTNNCECIFVIIKLWMVVWINERCKEQEKYWYKTKWMYRVKVLIIWTTSFYQM